MHRIGAKNVLANPLEFVILSEAKNRVPRVYPLGLYRPNRICNDEILRFAQNDSP